MSAAIVKNIQSAAYSPTFPKVYRHLVSLYDRAMGKPADFWTQRAQHELEGLIDTMSSLREDSAFSANFFRDFPADIAAAKWAVDCKSTPDDRDESQNNLAWRLYKLMREFGGSF